MVNQAVRIGFEKPIPDAPGSRAANPDIVLRCKITHSSIFLT
jgi:hypothetical protein